MYRFLLILALLFCCVAGFAQPVVAHYDDPMMYRLNRPSPHTTLHHSLDSQYRMSLNTGWRFCYAERVAKIPKGYANPDALLHGWEYIGMPHTFESEYGVGCYVRDVVMPAIWQGRRVLLWLESVSSAFHLYVNGSQVGYSEDSYTPAEFDITKYVVPGRNRIALRVYSSSTGAMVEYGGSMLRGVRGSAELYAMPQVYISDYQLQSQIDTSGNALLDATIDLSREVLRSYRVEMELFDTSTTPHTSLLSKRYKLERRDWFASFPKKFNNIGAVKPWSVEQPFLYRLEVRLLNDTDSLIQRVIVPIGFHSLAISKDSVAFNHKALHLRATQWQPPLVGCSNDSLRSTIELIMRSGFNCVVLQHPAYDNFYQMADSLGLLVMDCAGLGVTPALADSVARNAQWLELLIYHLHNTVRRNRNHPCVLGWQLGDDMPWGSNTRQLMQFLYDKEPQRITINPNDRRASIVMTENASALQLSNMKRSSHHLLMSSYPVQYTQHDKLGVAADTMAHNPQMVGLLYGPWEEMSYDDRAAMRTIALRVAPREMHLPPEPKKEEQHIDIPATEVTVVTEIQSISAKREFFLLRWIRKLFGN